MKRDSNTDPAAGFPVLALSRLLQLASPALPVGAYAYSQGLEAAVEAGIVRDAASAQEWIGEVLSNAMGRLEAPLYCRLQAAWDSGDGAMVEHWNSWFIASRETAELRAETLQMGYSLRRLIADEKALGMADASRLDALPAEVAFPTVFAFAASQWSIAPPMALAAYIWSWLENQVMAALKSVPLGQSDGQRLLATMGARIPAICEQAAQLADDGISNYLPGFAILCSAHETQYSRLFRS